MRTILRRDLTAAIKARDQVTVAALRSTLAAIENAEAAAGDGGPTATAQSEHIAGSVVGLGAAEVARRQLSDSELQAIVQAELDERSDAAAAYAKIGQDERAERLRAEADRLRHYLPPAG